MEIWQERRKEKECLGTKQNTLCNDGEKEKKSELLYQVQSSLSEPNFKLEIVMK